MLDMQYGSYYWLDQYKLFLWMTPWSDAEKQKLHRLDEILEFRTLLEPQIASLAAERIDGKILCELSEIVAQQEQSFPTVDRQGGREFCAAEYLRSRNDFLAGIRADELQSPERSRKALTRHKEILRWLVAGVPDEARRAKTDTCWRLSPRFRGCCDVWCFLMVCLK